MAPSLVADIAFLRRKQDNGADFLISQLCHDVEAFERFLCLIRETGVSLPMVVGIMPVLAKDALIRMTLGNGCSIPAELAAIIRKYRDDSQDFKKAGIECTIRQVHRYVAAGVEGIHLYTLKKWEEMDVILEESGIREPVAQARADFEDKK